MGGRARAKISCHTRLHRRTLLLAAEVVGETPTSALQGFGLFYMEWCVWAGHGPAFGCHSMIAVLDTVALPLPSAAVWLSCVATPAWRRPWEPASSMRCASRSETCSCTSGRRAYPLSCLALLPSTLLDPISLSLLPPPLLQPQQSCPQDSGAENHRGRHRGRVGTRSGHRHCLPSLAQPIRWDAGGARGCGARCREGRQQRGGRHAAVERGTGRGRGEERRVIETEGRSRGNLVLGPETALLGICTAPPPHTHMPALIRVPSTLCRCTS